MVFPASSDTGTCNNKTCHITKDIVNNSMKGIRLGLKSFVIVVETAESNPQI